MDDRYAINLLKTEIREAYNTGSPERLLAVLDVDFIQFADTRHGAVRKIQRTSCADRDRNKVAWRCRPGIRLARDDAHAQKWRRPRVHAHALSGCVEEE